MCVHVYKYESFLKEVSDFEERRTFLAQNGAHLALSLSQISLCSLSPPTTTRSSRFIISPSLNRSDGRGARDGGWKDFEESKQKLIGKKSKARREMERKERRGVEMMNSTTTKK